MSKNANLTKFYYFHLTFFWSGEYLMKHKGSNLCCCHKLEYVKPDGSSGEMNC